MMKVAPMTTLSSRSCCTFFLSCSLKNNRRRSTIGFWTEVSERIWSNVRSFRSRSYGSSTSLLSDSSENGQRAQRHAETKSSNRNSLSSTRGRAAVGLLPTYLADARAVARYHPTSQPNGALQLGVAESQMLEDWLVPALNTVAACTSDAIYYQPTSGRDDFKRVMASYIEDMCDLEQGRLNVDGLILGAGCNAVLENLCFTLADAGDTVLIPTPYYAAFEFDLVARAGLTVQAVTTEVHHPECTSYITSDRRIDPTIYYPNIAALNAAYETTLERTSSPPKILLLSHPMNPLGICYPSSVVQECIDWCRDRKVHLICDEIYAGSVYRASSANPFVSALKLADVTTGSADEKGLGPYVHWVYALSKDFALSGLRVGAAYTENTEIIVPMQKLNDLCQISSQTQLWTMNLLSMKIGDTSNDNELWITAFRRANHQRLNGRALVLTKLLDKYQIPYLAPEAGLFVWIDFSQFLPTTSDNSAGTADSPAADRERMLYLELVETHGLLLTPGNSMRNERPGFFRCVFSAASDEEFQLAMRRMESFLMAKGASHR